MMLIIIHMFCENGDDFLIFNICFEQMNVQRTEAKIKKNWGKILIKIKWHLREDEWRIVE